MGSRVRYVMNVKQTYLAYCYVLEPGRMPLVLANAGDDTDRGHRPSRRTGPTWSCLSWPRRASKHCQLPRAYAGVPVDISQGDILVHCNKLSCCGTIAWQQTAEWGLARSVFCACSKSVCKMHELYVLRLHLTCVAVLRCHAD